VVISLKACFRSLLFTFLGVALATGIHAKERDDLSSVVAGLRDSKSIVTRSIHPVVYLSSLKVSDPAARLSSQQRYQLARQLLDVHHLCMALSHQSYYVEPASAPILKLAEQAFPGFRRVYADGGYNTAAIAEFFEKNASLWAP
jgi:hypothetical protein